jgi:carotenoid cleavage dioxygenase-like enzyme
MPETLRAGCPPWVPGHEEKSMSADSVEATPFHLQGNFAPVKEEITVTDLRVEGALPPELTGLYVRQSPNPITGVSEHWFMGDGMLHGIRLENGRAAWYRNRYVKTPYLADPDVQRISEVGAIDRTVSKANTHILEHAGKLLALEEGSFPYVIDRELCTVGVESYGGKLTSAFSAHPKICPVTGEMISFGYGQLPPYLTYLRVSPDGKLVQSEEITVGGPTMMHDFAVTEHYAIFMDLPVVFSLEIALQGGMPFHWSDDYPARMGIMPRDGRDADVRWFEINPCFIFHTLNAYEQGDSVVLDACRSDEVWRNAGEMDAGAGSLTLHRFAFDLASGTVKEETLVDRRLEFPRVAAQRVGLPNRFGFMLDVAQTPEGTPAFAGVVKVDLATGATQTHKYGEAASSAEPVFVPAAGADPDSDEGWVMSYVHDEGSGRTSFVVLDASDLSKPPVASVELPQRVPYGFHGSWVPDRS